MHIFACVPVIKTCVTDLVLKDKKRSALKIFFILFTNCFNVLIIIFKKSQAYRRLQQFGVFVAQFKNINFKNDGSFVES